MINSPNQAVQRTAVWRRAFAAGLMFATFSLIADYLAFPGSHWHGVPSEIFRFIARALFFGTGIGYFIWRRYRRDSTNSSGGHPNRLTNQ
jgi:hypothetical protein